MKKWAVFLCILVILTQLKLPHATITSYKETLDESKQKAYQQMLEMLVNKEEQRTIALKEEELLPVYEAVMADAPQLFYVEGFQYHKVQQGYVVSPQYLFTKNQIMQYEQELNELKQALIKQFEQKPTTYLKVKAVYDFVIDQCSYKTDAKYHQTILSVLFFQESVCAGIAKTMKYLLNALDIPCFYLVGTSKANHEAHAWNAVKIDGEYVYVDATWGNQNKEGKKQKTYAYLGFSQEAFEQLYIPSQTIIEANGTTYFEKENKVIQQVEDVKHLIDPKQKMVEFACANETLYKEVEQNLFEEGNIYAMMKEENVSHVSLRYQKIDAMLAYQILWE